MANKILGYTLLAIGLVLIGWSLFQSFYIFTGKTSAPLVFQTPSAQELSLQQQTIQGQIEQTVQKQLNQILPPATTTKILNLAAWSFLAFVLITGGGAVSGIGVKLIK